MFANMFVNAVPLREHGELFEKYIGEHLGIRRLGARTARFTDWLLHQPESRVVVVGHSAFFRNLTDQHPDNVLRFLKIPVSSDRAN